MSFSKKTDITALIYVYAFLTFSFFSAIFCGHTRVNNLFHISAVFFLMTLFGQPEFRQIWLNRRAAGTGIALAACFLAYYSASNLWGALRGIRHRP